MSKTKPKEPRPLTVEERAVLITCKDNLNAAFDGLRHLHLDLHAPVDVSIPVQNVLTAVFVIEGLISTIDKATGTLPPDAVS